MSVHVIAEAGVNHDGDLGRALALVDAAAASGADTVKFQAFRADRLVSPSAAKADYQLRTTSAAESQLDMLRRLELPAQAYRGLAERCRERGIGFLVTPFDLPSVDFLAHDLGLDQLKIPSGEIVNGPLLLAVARTGRDLIVSTGMSTLDEVEQALGVLAFGFLGADEAPSRAAFRAAYDSAPGRDALRRRVTLLHCTSEYPAPVEEANLRAMDSMAEAFGLAVGLSDHTAGITVAVAAAARGAAVIEKHFTLDRALPGPDHQASLEPPELAEMVAAIRAVESALGDGIKRPAPVERSNREVVRKSLVAERAIRAGEMFSADNLGAKRPGTGISPMEYWAWLGRPAGHDLNEGEQVRP